MRMQRRDMIATRTKIVAAMDSRYWLRSEIARKTQISISTVKDHLTDLVADGQVEAEQIMDRPVTIAYRIAGPAQ